MWKVTLPPSPLEFSFHHHFYKLSCSKVAGRRPPLPPSLAGLFIYNSVRDCPSTPSVLRVPCSLCQVSFFFVVVVYSVFVLSFFPGWRSVCPGVYADLVQGCLWECCLLLSLPGGLHLPKQSGSWCLSVQETSWFLHLMWSGDAMCGLGVWSSQSFAYSPWFFL
jgi:hypothetical protein